MDSEKVVSVEEAVERFRKTPINPEQFLNFEINQLISKETQDLLKSGENDPPGVLGGHDHYYFKRLDILPGELVIHVVKDEAGNFMVEALQTPSLSMGSSERSIFYDNNIPPEELGDVLKAVVLGKNWDFGGSWVHSSK